VSETRASSGNETWYDLSPPLHSGMTVWPGDTPFSLDRISRMETGAASNVSSIHMSLHAGAHADAPVHLADGAPGVDEAPLDTWVGPATVIHRLGAKRIGPEDLEGLPSGIERLLIRTRKAGAPDAPDSPRPAPDRFDPDFAFLDPEAARFLASRRLRLLGIDSLSVDAFDAGDLESHRVLLTGGVAILEGIDLARVPEGDYELIALPLRVAGADGSPVRAVLRAGRRA
jgi:arylformamidase